VYVSPSGRLTVQSYILKMLDLKQAAEIEVRDGEIVIRQAPFVCKICGSVTPIRIYSGPVCIACCNEARKEE
jgi:hypothetical protein